VALADARLRVASASSKEADTRKKLISTLNMATEHGYLGYAYQLRLALGELEMKFGNSTAGRAETLAAARDTASQGFGLIARKATSTLQRPSNQAP